MELNKYLSVMVVPEIKRGGRTYHISKRLFYTYLFIGIILGLVVMTLAIEPVRKNSSIDCACAIENAEAMVPNRLAAPPKTTTRNVSTI